MDSQIETFYVDNYKSGVEIQYQQRVNRLLPVLREIGSQDKKTDYFDRIGASTEPEEVTSRNADIVDTEETYDRRGIYTRYYFKSKLFDDMDEVRQMNSVKAPVIENHALAMVRKTEKVIINAATDNALTQVAGENSTQAFLDTQVVPVNYVRSGSPSNSGLTKDKIVRARNMLIKKEVVNEGDPIFAFVGQDEIDDLTYLEEYINLDYTRREKLDEGVPVTWMGITWLRTEQLNVDSSGYKRCLFMPKGAIRFNRRSGKAMRKLYPLENKHQTIRAYTCDEFGATREWEEMIVDVRTNNS